MGKGKGNFDYWYFFVKTGRILFEFDSFNNQKLDFIIYKNMTKKLPVKTIIVFKNF